MLGCHYSKPAREKIKAMQAAGIADDRIVDDFVKTEGLRALVVPPAEGFNALAWVMPFLMIGIVLNFALQRPAMLTRPSFEFAQAEEESLTRALRRV